MVKVPAPLFAHIISYVNSFIKFHTIISKRYVFSIDIP
jgi:hypothetical protein